VAEPLAQGDHRLRERLAATAKAHLHHPEPLGAVDQRKPQPPTASLVLELEDRCGSEGAAGHGALDRLRLAVPRTGIGHRYQALLLVVEEVHHQGVDPDVPRLFGDDRGEVRRRAQVCAAQDLLQHPPASDATSADSPGMETAGTGARPVVDSSVIGRVSQRVRRSNPASVTARHVASRSQLAPLDR